MLQRVKAWIDVHPRLFELSGQLASIATAVIATIISLQVAHGEARNAQRERAQALVQMVLDSRDFRAIRKHMWLVERDVVEAGLSRHDENFLDEFFRKIQQRFSSSANFQLSLFESIRVVDLLHRCGRFDKYYLVSGEHIDRWQSYVAALTEAISVEIVDPRSDVLCDRETILTALGDQLLEFHIYLRPILYCEDQFRPYTDKFESLAVSAYIYFSRDTTYNEIRVEARRGIEGDIYDLFYAQRGSIFEDIASQFAFSDDATVEFCDPQA